MNDPYTVTFIGVQWSAKESAADAVAEVLAAHERRLGQPATVLVCNSGDLVAVTEAALAQGMPPGTQRADTTVWTRTMVRPRNVLAGRMP